MGQCAKLVQKLALVLAFILAAPAYADANGKVVLTLGAAPGEGVMQYTLTLRSADGRSLRDVTDIQDHPLANKHGKRTVWCVSSPSRLEHGRSSAPL